MPADGAAPQIKAKRRKRDALALTRIGWAIDKEVAAGRGITRLGFELSERVEQLERIHEWIKREGASATSLPDLRQLDRYWKKHGSLRL
jgi:hypothetical protein